MISHKISGSMLTCNEGSKNHLQEFLPRVDQDISYELQIGILHKIIVFQVHLLNHIPTKKYT